METCKAPYRADHDGPDYFRITSSHKSAIDNTTRYNYTATMGERTVRAHGIRKLAERIGVAYSSLKYAFPTGAYNGWTLARVKD